MKIKLKTMLRVAGKVALHLLAEDKKAQASQPKTPPSLQQYANQYKDGAWRLYKMYELGNFVHLLSKRASHRADPVKRLKDLTDAQNYLDMMQAKLDWEKNRGRNYRN